MTKKVLWMQPGEGDDDIEYAAIDDRQLIRNLFHDEGVFDTAFGSLKVSQRAAGANMSVDVAAGAAFIFGDDVSGQGMYLVYSDAVENIAVPDPPASGDRIHNLVAQVKDKLHNSGDWSTYEFDIVLLADDGTGKPDTPDSAISLAEIYVDSDTTSITDSAVNDQRQQACLITSKPMLVSADTDRTAVPYESELIWRTDKDCHEVYDGSSWVEIPRRGGGGSAWTTYTPSLTGTESNPSLGSGSTAQGRYWRVGRTVTVEVIIKFGSGMSKGGGFYEVSLPVTARTQTVGRRTGSAYVFDNSANEFYDGISFINSGATTKARLSINSDVVQDDVPITFAASDELGFQITYEAAS